MRWTPGDRSNVEDLRGSSGGGGLGMPLGIGGVVILLIGSWLTGINLFSLIGSGDSAGTSTAVSSPVSTTQEEEKQVDLVDAVMADIQRSWRERLPQAYQSTKGTLFRDSIH